MKFSTAFIFFFALLWAQATLASGLLVRSSPTAVMLVAIISLACAVFFATTAYSVFYGAPFVPMARERVEEMLDFAGVKAGERIADLGAGDGRIVVAAAKRGAAAEGWEINPYLWLLAQWNIRRAGVAGRAKMHLGSYWDAKFFETDLVTLFLVSTQMRRMEKKLRGEMKPGSRVASYVFTFADWEQVGKSPHGVTLYRQEATSVRHS